MNENNVKSLLDHLISKLREIYGSNLKYVLLFGSLARGEARKESDIDLLIVLDHFDNFWQERKIIGDLIYGLTFDSGNNIILSALPISLFQYQKAQSPFIMNVRKEQKSLYES